jgi:hypothetical protein
MMTLVRGWLRPTAAGHSAREREAFEPTRAGRRTFRVWLRGPATREQVVWGTEGAMLRFAFMGLILPAKQTIASLARELEAYVLELRRHHAGAAAGMPLSGRLALESGIDSYRAQARLARRGAKPLALFYATARGANGTTRALSAVRTRPTRRSGA